MAKKKIIITFNAPVILTFVLISLLATLAGVLTGGAVTRTWFTTWHSPLTDPLTYVRFFTHVFGHSGWSHFIGNATYLLLLGPMLEEKHGSETMVWIIGITALVTALVNYILFPHTALCGASGVVFAFIILASFTGFHEGEIPLTFLLVAGIYLGQQIIEGLTVMNNVSNMTHIIGGLVGAVLGSCLNRRPRKR